MRKELYMRKITAAIVLAGMFFAFSGINGAIAAGTSRATSATSTRGTSTRATKAQLDKLAKEMLKAAEERDNAALQIPFRKMAELGVQSVTPPEVHAKRTPTCPPVKMELNGRTLSGKLCARMSYEYEGKIYWVGYCK